MPFKTSRTFCTSKYLEATTHFLTVFSLIKKTFLMSKFSREKNLRLSGYGIELSLILIKFLRGEKDTNPHYSKQCRDFLNVLNSQTESLIKFC